MASQEALEKQKSPSGVFSYSPSGVFSGPFSLVDRKGFLILGWVLSFVLLVCVVWF